MCCNNTYNLSLRQFAAATESHESLAAAAVAGVYAEELLSEPQSRLSSVGDVTQAVPDVSPALGKQQREQGRELERPRQRNESNNEGAKQARNIDGGHHFSPVVEHIFELSFRTAEKSGRTHR